MILNQLWYREHKAVRADVLYYEPRITAIALKLKTGAILNRAGWTLKMNPPEAMENPLLPQ